MHQSTNFDSCSEWLCEEIGQTLKNMIAARALVIYIELFIYEYDLRPGDQVKQFVQRLDDDQLS